MNPWDVSVDAPALMPPSHPCLNWANPPSSFSATGACVLTLYTRYLCSFGEAIIASRSSGAATSQWGFLTQTSHSQAWQVTWISPPCRSPRSCCVLTSGYVFFLGEIKKFKNTKKPPQKQRTKNTQPQSLCNSSDSNIIFLNLAFPPVEAKNGALSSSRRVI